MNDDTERTDSPEPGQPLILPVLPVRDLVVFPHMVVPLIVVRDRSVRALTEAKQAGSDILLVTQRDAQVQEPTMDDLYTLGAVGRILQMLELPDGTMRVLVEGMHRGRIADIVGSDPMIRARVADVHEVEESSVQVQAMMRNVVSQFDQAVNLSRSIPPEALVTAMNVEKPGHLADLVAAYLSVPVGVKQDLLEALVATERLKKLTALLSQELEILKLEKKIQSRVRDEVQDSQKEYYLREQLRAIQDELGEREGALQEADEYREKIAKCGMPSEAAEKALREVERFEKMPPVAPEGTVIRTYLDWLVSLPW
ncbi:MAG: LON peptidase substrate-binding domain-containing protein, partial [Armatimonadota bacterium]